MSKTRIQILDECLGEELNNITTELYIRILLAMEEYAKEEIIKLKKEPNKDS